MARKVIWTETAWRDLATAAEYIAEDSPYYAASLVRRIRNGARSLAGFSERGRRVPELQQSSIREIFIMNYRLIYKVTKDRVYVLAIVHGARDLWSLWEREQRRV